MSGARIGRIRLKNGGAEVRVLDRRLDPGHGENWRGKIINAARIIAEHGTHGSDLVGYVIVGLFDDGAHSIGFRWDPDRVPVPRRLMPAYIEELVRENLITDHLIKESKET